MSDTTPETKVHKLYEQGHKDGRFSFHDGTLWASLSRPKRAAYDRGNISGRKSPVRC